MDVEQRPVLGPVLAQPHLLDDDRDRVRQLVADAFERGLADQLGDQDLLGRVGEVAVGVELRALRAAAPTSRSASSWTWSPATAETGHDLGPLGAGLLRRAAGCRAGARPIRSGRREVGLGGDRDLGGAPHLGHLGDDEPVARPDLLVGSGSTRRPRRPRPRWCGTRSLSRSPSRVRGRCSPGVSTRISWRVRAVHDAAHHGPRGLRLVGGDHDLLADQRVGERRLAGVGPARRTTRSRSGSSVMTGSCTRGLVVLRPRSARRTCPCALPARQIGPGSTARGCRPARRAPVAHHVVRRARQLAGRASGACGSRASARTRRPSRSSRRPSGQSIDSTTSASRLLPRRRLEPGDVRGVRRGSRAGRRRPRPRSGSAGRPTRRSGPSPASPVRSPTSISQAASAGIANEPFGSVIVTVEPTQSSRTTHSVTSPTSCRRRRGPARRRRTSAPCSSGSGTAPAPPARPTRRGCRSTRTPGPTAEGEPDQVGRQLVAALDARGVLAGPGAHPVHVSGPAVSQRRGGAGSRSRPSASVLVASTWWSWISLRSKAIREPAM